MDNDFWVDALKLVYSTLTQCVRVIIGGVLISVLL